MSADTLKLPNPADRPRDGDRGMRPELLRVSTFERMNVWASSVPSAYWLVVCLGAAVAARVAMLFYVQRTDWDGFFYMLYAQNILRGDWLAPSPLWTPYPILYPLAIAFVSALGPDLERSAAVVSLLSGIVIVPTVYWIGHRVGGRRPALLAGLLAALNPWLVRNSLAVLSEALFTALLMALLAIWLKAARGERIRGLLPLSFLLSLALTMTRPIALAVLLGGVMAAWLTARDGRKLAIQLAIGTVTCAVIYFVYAQAVSLHLEALTGQTQPSYVLQELSRGVSSYFDGTIRPSPYVPGSSAVQFVTANGYLIERRFVTLLMEHLSNGITWAENGQFYTIVPFYIAPFVGIGAWLSRGGRWRLFPLIAIALYPLAAIPFVEDPRYFIPVLPVLLIYVGIGLAGMIRGGNSLYRWLPAALVFGLSIMQIYQYNFHVYPPPVDPARTMGSWLSQNERPDVVVSGTPGPAFYAHAELVWLDATPDIAAISRLVEDKAGHTHRVAVVMSSPPIPLPPGWELLNSVSSAESSMYAYRVTNP